ncbi:MAG: metal-dependent transcriptional regulator [Ruminiclostridium sp.]|nr:metal-dependent transcriptional regulator [Ruminiclostridium sp.]
MNLQESGEMYLETILILSEKKNAVRSIDICDEMGFSKPSISRAIHLLEDGGYLEIDNNGFITLTDIGREVAETIYERHTVLTEVFMSIGVDRETASEDACRIEHVISDKTFQAIKKHIKKSKKTKK